MNPERGLSLNYLINTLETLQEPKIYTEFLKSSIISHKTTFFLYMKWCISKNLIKKETRQVIVKSTSRFGGTTLRQHNVYMLTDEGRSFLEMVR